MGVDLFFMFLVDILNTEFDNNRIEIWTRQWNKCTLLEQFNTLFLCEGWQFYSYIENTRMTASFYWEGRFWSHKTSLTPTRFIEVHAQSQESEQSCSFVLGVSIFLLSIFPFYWTSEMFRHCGILCFYLYVIFTKGRRHRMVVGFTITFIIRAYQHWSCEFESRSDEVYSIQHYVTKFVSYLRQVGSFLRALRFYPSITLTATI